MTYTPEETALIHSALSYYSAQLDSDLNDEFGDDDTQEVLTATNSLLTKMEDTTKTFDTEDMFLVYVSEDGSHHAQHWRDIEDVGTLLEEDSEDDMEIVGWTSDPAEIRALTT